MLAKPSQTIYHRYKSPVGNTDVFPQAKVFDMDSGDVVATKNLSVNANDTSLYEVTDTAPSSEGLYHIVITPYTSSAYTTRYESEGATIENLEVRADRHVAAASFGGEGGVMESDIKAIIDGVVKKLKDPLLKAIEKIKIQERDVDLGPIMEALNSLPQPEKYDDGQVKEALVRIEKKIVPINIVPLKQAIDRIDTASIKKDLQEIKSRPLPEHDNTPVISAITALGEKIKEPNMDYVEGCMNRIETLSVGVLRNLTAMPGHTEQAKTEIAGEMLKLGQMLAEHKDLMFKMDDLQKARFGKLVETLRQMDFLSSVNMKEALGQIQKVNLINEVEI